ncbi:TPA: hypothetical protein NGS68_000539 [Vibrio parahaemolyticus]|nr:hypothetical protein [Vibrio parahaemolyticus]HCG6655993.1 hypothetical protein [Vibrio parahaemolyticus]HCG6660037.1 hypothetical protein [Vibrio parahaemolyticus]
MSRRKSLQVDDDIFGVEEPTVEVLRLEDMVLKASSKCHLIQLNYKYAPNFNQVGKKIEGIEYIPMGREKFVRQVYKILKPDFNSTKQSRFKGIKYYLRWLDENNLTSIEGDLFHKSLYESYMEYWELRVSRNEAKKSTWNEAKKTLSFMLKALGRETEAKNLKSIKGTKKDTDHHEGIDIEGELRPTIKRFLSAFKVYGKHIEDGTYPEFNPIWDESLFDDTAKINGWSTETKEKKKNLFKTSVYHPKYDYQPFLNHLSRLGAMLTFCFTGQNSTPILNLKFSDIRFCNKMNGKAYFDMTKDRANYLKFDTSIGFKPHVQAFFQTWLKIAKKVQEKTGTDWLFPWHTTDGKTKSFVEAGQLSPQKKLNELTASLGLVKVNASTLRQTKIDTLLKVTQDIWLVSMSSNSSVQVISASYGNGNKNDQQRNIAASHVAMYDMAIGNKEFDQAIKEAKYEFRDVLSEYEYKKLKDTDNDKLTTIGTRCKEPTKGFAEVIKKNLEKEGVETKGEELACTDFLSCFECKHHRLVSAVEDIWLMLSFNDTLIEMKEYPSINSLPTDKFYKICNTVESILDRFKYASPENFSAAQKKHSIEPHPLYSDGYSLIDLLEIY